MKLGTSSFASRSRARGLPRGALLRHCGLGLLALASSIAAATDAAASAADDKQAIAALDTQYQAAVKKNDAATMDRLLADDFMLVEATGATYTKADLLKDARSGRYVFEHQEDTAQSVRVWGDTAVITAKLWEKGRENGKPFEDTLWFSDTYVRTPTGWRYVFGHASLPLMVAEKIGGSRANAVRSADAAWLKAFAAKDLDKSIEFVDEQGSMLAPNAPIAAGKAEVAQAIAGDFAHFDAVSWRADKAGVCRSGDLGYTSGTTMATVKDGTGKPAANTGKYLTLWRRQADGSWKVLFDIFNSDLPAP